MKSKKGRFPTQYRDIESPGIEINADDETRSEPIDFEGITDDSQMGDEKLDHNENQLRKKEKTIIKSKRLFGESCLGNWIYLGSKRPYSNMIQASLESHPGVNGS